MSLSAEAIAEIEQRANAATEGLWNTSGPDTIGQWMIYDADWAVASATAYDHDKPMGATRGPGYIDPDANAAFIAQAREDVPALVADLRAARAEIDDLRLADPHGRFVSGDAERIVELERALHDLCDTFQQNYEAAYGPAPAGENGVYHHARRLLGETP